MSAVLEEIEATTEMPEESADTLEGRARILWDTVDEYEAVRIVGEALGDLFVDTLLRRRNREQLLAMARFVGTELERLEQ